MSEKVNIYLDGAEEYDIMLGGEVFEFVVDRLIRHKFPDEKPNPRDATLIRKAYNGVFEIAWYDGENWWSRNCTFPIDGVTEWWELPEVKE